MMDWELMTKFSGKFLSYFYDKKNSDRSLDTLQVSASVSSGKNHSTVAQLLSLVNIFNMNTDSKVYTLKNDLVIYQVVLIQFLTVTRLINFFYHPLLKEFLKMITLLLVT